jgi:hypothetical protein
VSGRPDGTPVHDRKARELPHAQHLLAALDRFSILTPRLRLLGHLGGNITGNRKFRFVFRLSINHRTRREWYDYVEYKYSTEPRG